MAKGYSHKFPGTGAELIAAAAANPAAYPKGELYTVTDTTILYVVTDDAGALGTITPV